MKRLILALSAWLMTVPACAADLIAFWDVPEHGGNSFNAKPPSLAYFRALRGYGSTWVRLTPSKWKGEGRDFLIGNADHYAGIPPQDLKLLVAAHSNREIARSLGIEERTVKAYIARLMRKVGVENRIALSIHAASRELASPEDN